MRVGTDRSRLLPPGCVEMTTQDLRQKNDTLIPAIVGALRSYDPEKVILFGSRARSQDDEYSDIDLVIIKRTEEDFLDSLSKVARLLSALPESVDVLVYTPEEVNQMLEEGRDFILMVLEEGKVIYEKQAGG